MTRYDIIAALDSEIQRLQEARSAIMFSSSTGVRPPAMINRAVTPTRKGISEAGRERIAEAQRKRWAAQKAAKSVETKNEAGRSGKKAVKKTASDVAITRFPPKQPRGRTRAQRSATLTNALSSRAGTVAVPVKSREAAA